MAASTIASLITSIRDHLTESTASFWTDAELARLINAGSKDLWRAINDNYQHYFLTIDATNVSQAASSSTLTGVPTDVSIVRGLEARDLNARPGLNYFPRDCNHVDFQRARSLSAQDPSQGLSVYYCITGAGAPVAAPTIQVAPIINAAVLLRLTYVPTLATVTAAGTNLIPGESDNALIAWAVAYARAKETEESQPDAGWLTIYGTEKQNILVSLTPRQTDDEDVAEAFFEDLWV